MALHDDLRHLVDSDVETVRAASRQMFLDMGMSVEDAQTFANQFADAKNAHETKIAGARRQLEDLWTSNLSLYVTEAAMRFDSIIIDAALKTGKGVLNLPASVPQMRN